MPGDVRAHCVCGALLVLVIAPLGLLPSGRLHSISSLLAPQRQAVGGSASHTTSTPLPAAQNGTSKPPAAAPPTQHAASAHACTFVPGDTLTFMTIGDWGLNNSVKLRLARLLGLRAARETSAFTVSVGDNFYYSGVSSVSDPKFDTLFETPFSAPALAHRWYISLGNHDHRGNVDAQIQRSKVSQRWHLPARWYSEVLCVAGQRLHLLVLDSHRRGWRTQVRWAAAELTRTPSDWRVVINHNPLYSAAQRPLIGNMHRTLEPLLAHHRVHLYLNGHMHLLEVYRSLSHGVGYTGVTSGSFCDLYTIKPPRRWPPQMLFSASVPGFTVHRLHQDVLTTEVISIDDEVLATVDVRRDLRDDGSHRTVRIHGNRTHWTHPSLRPHY
eukprot:GGOE01049755.1.p1 GENE.GGOE01049755.1~~GGOE01049755.1.p1  ORF type:complete len:384 (-),score=86.83 GGOE01049755.1:35-1186(-)